MQKNTAIQLIGYACGAGAGDVGCADGVQVLRQSETFLNLLKQYPSLHWQETIQADDKASSPSEILLPALTRLTQAIVDSQLRQHATITIGGDHSSAIGTWSGVFNTLPKGSRLGLMWVDAHLDAHTEQTTPSDNIHGMPLACLLGHGAASLTSILTSTNKLQAEDVVVIGVRSFEEGEHKLLKELGVRIYYMDEIAQRGFASVFAEGIAHIKRYTRNYGLSIDLDGIDPTQAPGVGIRVEHGIDSNDLLQALLTLQDDTALIAAEIVEFNPHWDSVDGKTEKLLVKLIGQFCQIWLTHRC